MTTSRESDSAREHRCGLVLSGGGARGVAHLALLDALAEVGVAPTALAGSSAGALVAAMQACGLEASERLDFFRHTELFRWQNLSFGRKAGLLDSDKILRSLLDLFGDCRIEDLGPDLVVSTTDLQSGRERLVRTGSVARAVMASCAVPGVMSPVEIEGHLHADGGLIDLLPVESLRGGCALLCGSHVSAVEEVGVEALDSSLAVLHRAFQIAGSAEAIVKLRTCDFEFVPQGIGAVGMFELDMTDEVHARGLGEARPVAKAIAERLAE